jgi:GntR family transcriptional regulator / MocR family aminotransferase
MKISHRPVAAPGSGSWEVTLVPGASDAPLYVRIVQAVVADIRRGRLVPGQRLPGSRTLAQHLGVHRNTVLSAYAELEAEGWIASDPARHTIVCETLPDALPPHGRKASAATLGFPLPGGDHDASDDPWQGLQLSDGTPDPRLVPRAALSRAYRRVLRGKDLDVLGYGDPRGHERLRAALAAMLAATRGLNAGADGLLVTRGSQMALELISRALIQPGDVVAVEELGYRPAWQALAAAGARLVPVALDGEGLSVDQLDALARRTRLRALYVTPHHQYPTTATLSAARRLALLELARQRRFAIIEDDYDHEFHYHGRPVLPLASADTAGVVLYVGTLSKVLAPSLRLGYLVAPAPVLARCSSERRHLDRQGDSVVECAVAELIEDGELQRHARRMRRVYQARREALVASLERCLPGRLVAVPASGGMALWARADGVDVDAWAERARAQGLVLLSARWFAFDRRPRPFVRLGFAVRSAEETARAIERLAKLVPRQAR